MAINETIVTGRKFRKLTDEATKQWQRFSFWTKASDVEFDDGNTLEDKIVNINGTADLLQEQVNNLNTDANGKINSLITEINGLKETVEDLKTNPPSPPSPPEQNLPLVLSGTASMTANKINDGDDEEDLDDLIIMPWTNGSAAYLSSAGTVNGIIQLKYTTGNSIYIKSYGDGTMNTNLYLLSYPTTSFCPPLNDSLDQTVDRAPYNPPNFWATKLGRFKIDGTLEFYTHDFPAGYLWIGGFNAPIAGTNWRNAHPDITFEHISVPWPIEKIISPSVGFVVDFSQATFTQT